MKLVCFPNKIWLFAGQTGLLQYSLFRKWNVRASVISPAHVVLNYLTVLFIILSEHNGAVAWDFQQCGMCDQQSLRSACACAQSDQSLC